MKKFLLIIVVASLAISSCKKEEEVTPSIKIEKKSNMEMGGEKKDVSMWD